MFQGFNESTIMYYKAIRKENCKKVYQDNEQLYLEGVRYPLDNKHYAKRVIKNFNEANLLEIHGEKYNRAYYPKEDIILQEWLERKRVSCIHEEKLSAVFMREKF